MLPLTRAADMELSVRARRTACVVDPALLLSTPAALLLVRQLASVVDIWVCPALWRLLDASEFYLRSPDRLARWLDLPGHWPVEQVAQALSLCSQWRASHDLTALGAYWVGLHQTESYLPEHGPRDVPSRFEALLTGWPTPTPAPTPDSEDPTEDRPNLDTSRECAALSASLHGAPVLTLAASEAATPPPLAHTWASDGLQNSPWPADMSASAQAEQHRWLHWLQSAGAAPTAATGLRLSVAHVVAPMAQFIGHGSGGTNDDFTDHLSGDVWPAEPLGRNALPIDATHAWQGAQALWLTL